MASATKWMWRSRNLLPPASADHQRSRHLARKSSGSATPPVGTDTNAVGIGLYAPPNPNLSVWVDGVPRTDFTVTQGYNYNPATIGIDGWMSLTFSSSIARNQTLWVVLN